MQFRRDRPNKLKPSLPRQTGSVHCQVAGNNPGRLQRGSHARHGIIGMYLQGALLREGRSVKGTAEVAEPGQEDR